jgi:hypothetical protein
MDVGLEFSHRNYFGSLWLIPLSKNEEPADAATRR